MRRQMSLLLECCGLGAQRTGLLFLTCSISKVLFTRTAPLHGKMVLGNGRPAASLLVLVLVHSNLRHEMEHTCEGSYASPAFAEERSHSIHSLAELHGSANGKVMEPAPLPAKYASADEPITGMLRTRCTAHRALVPNVFDFKGAVVHTHGKMVLGSSGTEGRQLLSLFLFLFTVICAMTWSQAG